jgi:MFS transporter, ACS family, glucarate transporter
MPSAIQRARRRVIALLILLFAVTYLDRVCISVAGPRMQDDLHIDPVKWGWVTGIFTLAYCLFEFPTGALGDRFGPRRTLTRIVLWWSAFTALTGAVSRYPVLLAIRFLFGAGEAGAFPNAGVVVARWFPPAQRATLSGVFLMASQIGGALAPLLVVPIQVRWGWRASFFVLGLLGVFWSSAWYAWFRDSPTEKFGTVDPTGDLPTNDTDHSFPWRAAVRSRSVGALLVVGFCYVYAYNFFQTWFHTFLVKGRGVPEALLWLSAVPYVAAACGNLFGGALSDKLVTRLGRTNGRRFVGITCLVAAAAAVLAAARAQHQVSMIVLLSLAYGAIATQQSVAFSVCLDLGHRSAGAMIGVFNTVCQLGGLVGSIAYGYIVSWSGSYNAPFVPMAALLFLGAYFWRKVDASQELVRQSGAGVSTIAEQA